MLGNAVRAIFLFGVSSWPRRSVRCPGRTQPKANRPLKAPLWPHLRRGFSFPTASASGVGGSASLWHLFQHRPRLPGVPALLELRLGLLQSRHAIRARHRVVDGHRPEPAQIVGTAACFVDAATRRQRRCNQAGPCQYRSRGRSGAL